MKGCIIMKRMFGMMPSKETEVSNIYDDGDGMKVTIEAGPNGWTILMADGSSRYKDESKGTEANLAEAEKIAKGLFPDLKKISSGKPVKYEDAIPVDLSDVECLCGICTSEKCEG